MMLFKPWRASTQCGAPEADVGHALSLDAVLAGGKNGTRGQGFPHNCRVCCYVYTPVFVKSNLLIILKYWSKEDKDE